MHSPFHSLPQAVAVSATELFAFENDFVETLRCIPMAVRFKLDMAEVKLSLRQWSRFTTEDRRGLVLMRCESPSEVLAYRERLVTLLADRLCQQPAPLPAGFAVEWRNNARAPEQVVLFARSTGVAPPSDQAWGRLTDLQRFVLLKLSRDNHDNVNFVPALREFGMLYAEPDSVGDTAS